SYAEAIPAFARRYELPCHFCHDGYPKLSVLGEQFKERGYRLDSDTTAARDWWRSVPVSFRGTLRQAFVEEGDADTTGRFRFMSGGNLGTRLSYWIDESYSVDGDGFDRAGTDNAYLRVELLPDELYLRGGRLELDLPFTQARTPQLFAYEVYFANTGFETDNIGTHQDGIEAGGFLDEGTRWSIAVVRGQNSDEQRELSDSAGRFDGNLFGRLVRRFGEDRAGVYLYWGRNDLARTNPDPQPGEPTVLEWGDDLFRAGFDGSLYVSSVHLYGTFLYGRNGNSFADTAHPNGTDEALSFTGGFGQLDYYLRNQVVISGRLDWIHGPPPGTVGPSKSTVAFSPGLKLWLHPRVRLAFEFSFRNQDQPTRGAIQVDLGL
ncbi:MAG: hypothetical protein ACRD21_01575, partial [Vicinamibacteria bacterium]